MNTTLHHIIRTPKVSTKQPPLLILLHGYGSNEQDLFSFASELPDELLIVSARAPYEMGYDAYAWYAINFDAQNGKFSDLVEAEKSIHTIANFIDEIKTTYSTNPDKTFLLGFSQGAILSYLTSFYYPNKVNYVIALSGYINFELLPAVIDNNITTEYYCSHGSVDQVLPVEWARKTAPYLNSLGFTNTYSEYPVGHGVAPQNFFSFKEWIIQRMP